MTKKTIHPKRAGVPAYFAALVIAPFVFSSCGGLSKSDRETVVIPPAPVSGDPSAVLPGVTAEDPMAKPTEPVAPPYDLATAEKYVIQSGDTLSGIATKYGVSISDVKAANKLSDANKIRAGQTLLVPGQAAEPPTEPVPVEATPATPELPAIIPESAAGSGLPPLPPGE